MIWKSFKKRKYFIEILCRNRGVFMASAHGKRRDRSPLTTRESGMNIFYDPLSPWRLPLRFFYPANWCAEGFEEDFAWIQQHPEARNAGNLLTDHNGKYVWRIELPNGHGAVAYKFCEGKAANRYILHLSHPGREWRNYQAIERMGVPSGKVLAFGEKRKHHWKLEESFIITRFIENTRSGIDFMPGGKLPLLRPCRTDADPMSFCIPSPENT